MPSRARNTSRKGSISNGCPPVTTRTRRSGLATLSLLAGKSSGVTSGRFLAGQLPELQVAAAAVTDSLETGLVAHDDVRAEQRHGDRVGDHLLPCEVEEVRGLRLGARGQRLLVPFLLDRVDHRRRRR